MSYKILLALAVFMLCALAGYAVTPAKYRYVTLLLVSTACIVWVSGWGACFIVLTALSTYLAGIGMEKIAERHSTQGLEKAERKKVRALIKHRKKWLVFFYICLNLGILAVLKYFNFFSTAAAHLLRLFGLQTEPLLLKFAVPLGLSYYTLQALSYVIDVFRGKYKAEHNVLKLSLFVLFFPQLHEGPFGRYDELMPQMCSGRQLTLSNLYSGGFRVIWGLFKIFMVANRAALLSDAVFSKPQSYGNLVILCGAAAFTLQLYAEFSGYIDIAAGISQMLGIQLAQNFDMPFLSQNVAEFWRRWHISLGAFFRDYVFYPISTSKGLRKLTKKLSFTAANTVSITVSLLAVWFLTGLWHGANEKYIAYGLYYFVLIWLFNLLSPSVEKWLAKHHIASDNKVLVSLRVFKTWVLVLVGMMLFRAENIQTFGKMFCRIFAKGARFALFDVMEGADFAVLLLSVLVLLLSAVCRARSADLWAKYNQLPYYQRYIICFSVFCVIMVFGAYGLDYLPPDPIYGGF